MHCDTSPPLAPKGTPAQSPRGKPGLRGLTLLAWLAAAGFGLWQLERYAHAPGAAGQAPQSWPAGSSLPWEADRANLVLFAHPLCPCTRATMTELRTLLTKIDCPVSVRVAFFSPSNPPTDWQVGDLRSLAQSIPGATVVDDVDGQEAARFGAATSGWTVLFDSSGRRQFAGGITAARGHEGRSAGAEAILRCLANAPAPVDSTPVFGCPISGRCDNLSGAPAP